MITIKIDKHCVAKESIELYKSYMQQMGAAFNAQTEPWVPIGNIGPIVIIAHYDGKEECDFFPCAEKYLVDRRTYIDLLSILTEEYAAVSADNCSRVKSDRYLSNLEKFPNKQNFLFHKNFWKKSEEDQADAWALMQKFSEGQPICDIRPIILPEGSILHSSAKKRFGALHIATTDKNVVICTSSKSTLELKDQILQKTPKKPFFVFTCKELIREKNELLDKLSRSKNIHKTEEIPQESADSLSQNTRLKIDIELCEQISPKSFDSNFENLLQWVVYQAYIQEASDIHFEPTLRGGRVRFRIQGELKPIFSITAEAMRSLVNVAMNTCKMQHGDSLNQDNSFVVDINGFLIAIRANAIPCRESFPKLTYRLLPKNSQKVYLKDVVANQEHQEALERAITRKQGLILITGPTGEGKTTTLYACLQAINRPDINIQTIEDPIERELDGINQTQINPKKDITFAKVMRSVLRQDPDVILLGEVRDKESAELAVEAALTGHLVFSTLHTNSAIKAINRLLQLGIPSYLFADSLLLIQAQRLAKKLCPHCKKRRAIDLKEAAILDKHGIFTEESHAFEPGSCPRCHFTGFAGRTAVMEIIQFDEVLTDMISKNENISVIKRHIESKDFKSFFKDALRQAIQGIISFEEAMKFEPAWEDL